MLPLLLTLGKGSRIPEDFHPRELYYFLICCCLFKFFLLLLMRNELCGRLEKLEFNFEIVRVFVWFQMVRFKIFYGCAAINALDSCGVAPSSDKTASGVP